MMKQTFFHPTWKLIALTLLVSTAHLLLILQLIPVFESQTTPAKLVNLIVFPANFLFEDILGITSDKTFDIATWILHIAYGYLITCALRKTYYSI